MKRIELCRAQIAARLIEKVCGQSNPDSYVRELTQNVWDEARRGFEKGKFSKSKPCHLTWGYIRFKDQRDEYVPKQAIMDTGFSFDKNDMIAQFETFGTTNADNTDKNFGLGGKVSTLPGNPYGVLYICYTENDGNFAVICHKDTKNTQYVMSEIPWKEFKRMVLVPKRLSDPIKEAGHGTIVALLGKSEADDTMAIGVRPYHWIAKYLNTRYFKFPDYIKTKSLPALIEVTEKDNRHVDDHGIYGLSKLFEKRYAAESGSVELSTGTVHWAILNEIKVKGDSHGNSYRIGGGIYIGDDNEIYSPYEKRDRKNEDVTVMTSERDMRHLDEFERINRKDIDDVYRNFDIVYGKKRIVLYVALRNTVSDIERSGIKFSNGHMINPSMIGEEFRKKMPAKLLAFLNEMRKNSSKSNSINKDRYVCEKWLESMRCWYTDNVNSDKMAVSHDAGFRGKTNGYKDGIGGEGKIDAITRTSAKGNGKNSGAYSGSANNGDNSVDGDIAIQGRGEAHIPSKRPKHPQSYRGIAWPIIESDANGEIVDNDKFAIWVERSVTSEKPKMIYSLKYSGYKMVEDKIRDCTEFKATTCDIYDALHKEITKLFMEAHACVVGVGKKEDLKNNDMLTFLFDSSKTTIFDEAKKSLLAKYTNLPDAVKKATAKQAKKEKETVTV